MELHHESLAAKGIKIALRRKRLQPVCSCSLTPSLAYLFCLLEICSKTRKTGSDGCLGPIFGNPGVLERTEGQGAQNGVFESF